MAVKWYRVSYGYRETGSIDVVAESAGQAELMIQAEMERNGLDVISDDGSYQNHHREYEVDGSEEITTNEHLFPKEAVS